MFFTSVQLSRSSSMSDLSREVSQHMEHQVLYEPAQYQSTNNCMPNTTPFITSGTEGV